MRLAAGGDGIVRANARLDNGEIIYHCHSANSRQGDRWRYRRRPPRPATMALMLTARRYLSIECNASPCVGAYEAKFKNHGGFWLYLERENIQRWRGAAPPTARSSYFTGDWRLMPIMPLHYHWRFLMTLCHDNNRGERTLYKAAPTALYNEVNTKFWPAWFRFRRYHDWSALRCVSWYMRALRRPSRSRRPCAYFTAAWK